MFDKRKCIDIYFRQTTNNLHDIKTSLKIAIYFFLLPDSNKKQNRLVNEDESISDFS